MPDTDQNVDQVKDDQEIKDEKVKVPDVDKIVQDKIDEALKPIKGSLDKAYAARDEALKKVAEFEKQQREAEVKRLQEEGKHREAFELQVKEEREKREALEKKVVELTRDTELKGTLANLNFRNQNAMEMAYKEMVSGLVRNEQGNWVHKSGVSISDYAKSFKENSDNAFLFKQKANTGSGSGNITPSSDDSKPKSVFEMSQEEVLKRASEGTLPKRK